MCATLPSFIWWWGQNLGPYVCLVYQLSYVPSPLFIYLFESCCVAHVDLELLDSSYPPTSASCITGMTSVYSWLLNLDLTGWWSQNCLPVHRSDELEYPWSRIVHQNMYFNNLSTGLSDITSISPNTFLLFLCFWNKVSVLCSSGYLWTHLVDQAGLEFTEDPPASSSQMLELEVCATIPDSKPFERSTS